MPKNPQLVNRKNFIKKLTCADNRRQKSKKGDSISPIHKQINLQINENIHPNCYYREIVNFTNPRQQFYFLKNKSEEKEKLQIQHPLPPVNSPLLKPEVKNKHNQQSIFSRSVDKCHLYHDHTAPKPQYFAEKVNKNEDCTCCEECTKKQTQKVSLKKHKDSLLGKYGVTIGECCQKLNENLNTLQNLKDNLVLYQVKYQEHIIREEAKHSQYYQKLIEIVKEAKQKSGLYLGKKINEGISIFSKKLNEITFQIKKTKKTLRDLLQPQNKEKNSQKIDVDEAYRLYHFDTSFFTDVSLPFVSISLSKNLLPSFRQIFKENYGLELLKEKELLEIWGQESKIDKKISNDLTENSKKLAQNIEKIETGEKTSTKQQKQENKKDQNLNYYGEKKCNGEEKKLKSQKTTKSMRYKNIDQNTEDFQLYCEETLRDSVKKPFIYEVDSKNQDGIFPIIQLTEEEDIISPAFKDI